MAGGSRKVLGGFDRVLGGSRRVLGGSSRVLGGSSRVLSGFRRVLGGSCNVLAVNVRMPGGSFRWLMLVDDELGGRHVGAQDALGVDVIARHAQAAEGVRQLLDRQTGIEQRAERHVPRNPGEAVEIEYPAHSCAVSLKLKYRKSPRIT